MNTKQTAVNGRLVLALGSVFLVAGCAGTKYYKVTDPHSKNVYYTQKFDSLNSGSIQLKDGRTNSVVTIQNSEVSEIDSKQYQDGLSATVAPPTPVAPPASTPSK